MSPFSTSAPAFTHAPSPPHPETSPIHLTFGVTPGIHTYLLGKSLLLTQAVSMPSLPQTFINKMHEGDGCPQHPLSSQVNLDFPSRWFLEKYRNRNSELLQSCMLTCIKGRAFKREGLQRKCEARPHHAVWWIQNLLEFL